MKNASQVCDPISAEDTEDTCASGKSKLVVDPTRRSSSAGTRSWTSWRTAGRRSPATSTRPQQLRAAKQEPVVLAPQVTPPWVAPHFVWAVQQELADKLCGGAATCTALEQGGLKIITTLDWRLQQIAEKWVQAAAILPHSKNPAALAKRARLPYAAVDAEPARQGRPQRRAGRHRLPDRRARRLRRQRRLLRDEGHASSSSPSSTWSADGWRQPGSAFKPFNYVTGINDRTMTAATMFMDVTTELRRRLHARPTPTTSSAARCGCARRSSSRSTSPRSRRSTINGVDHVFARRPRSSAWSSKTDKPTAGAVDHARHQEVHPVDLVTAYGDPRQRRQEHRPHDDPGGHRTSTATTSSRRTSRRPATQVVGAAGGVHRHRHPGRQHRPQGQPVLGRVRAHRPGRQAPAGDAEDRHEQRREGPQRLRLHRRPLGRRPDGGQVRARGRRLGRQQRQHA